MRVLWVLEDLSWSAGSILASWVAPILIEGGVDLEVLPLTETEDVPVAWPDAVTVLDAPIAGRLLRDLRITGLLRRAFSRYDQVIVDQTLDLELKAIMAMGGVSRRAPLVVMAHIPLTEYLAARGENQVGRLRKLIDGLYCKMDRVISVSDAVGSDLISSHGVPRDRWVFVPPPVPVSELLLQSRVLPDAWPFPDDGVPVVSTMGRLEALKGIEVLLNAAKVLQDEGQSLRLVIVGDGSQRQNHEILARSLGLQAYFPGWVDNPGAWLAPSTIFVAPQYFDGFGWDMYMAMAVGVPVIATNAPAVSTEVLAKGTVGKIVSIGEPLAMAEAIHKWLANDRIRDAFAIGGKQRARGISREKMAKRWYDAVMR